MLFGKYASRKSEARYPSLWDGLVGAWCPSLQSPSGVNLYDLSGRNRHGVLTNMDSVAWVRESGSYTLRFDGVNDHVATGAALSRFMSSTTGSISIWVKPTGTAPTIANAWLGGFIGDDAGFMSLSRGIIGGSDRLWAYNFDGNEDRVGVAYTIGVWTHLVWAHVGGTLSLYKDGQIAGSTASANTLNMTGALNIGRIFSSYSAFQGEIDDMRVYSRAVGSGEIRLLASRRGIAFEPRRSISFRSAFRFRGNYSQIFTTGVIG